MKVIWPLSGGGVAELVVPETANIKDYRELRKLILMQAAQRFWGTNGFGNSKHFAVRAVARPTKFPKKKAK